jgi:hypothetical protein
MESVTETLVSPIEQDSKLVQMRLQRKTLERITKLSRLINSENRTQLIVTCLEISDVIISSITSGGKIYIESKDGTREQLKIIGLDKQ